MLNKIVKKFNLDDINVITADKVFGGAAGLGQMIILAAAIKSLNGKRSTGLVTKICIGAYVLSNALNVYTNSTAQLHITRGMLRRKWGEKNGSDRHEQTEG